MILNILTTSPTFMLYFLAGLQDISEDVYEAASIDGSVGAHRFFRITVPMLRPIIFLVVVLGTIGTLQIFDQAFIMTNGGPLNQTTTINLLIYRSAFTDFNMAYSAAIAVILFVMILILYLVPATFPGQEQHGPMICQVLRRCNLCRQRQLPSVRRPRFLLARSALSRKSRVTTS